jgi:hypothetical protein
MTRPRYTLKTIFALFTLAAVGCAALVNPTELWVSAVFSAAPQSARVALTKTTIALSKLGFRVSGVEAQRSPQRIYSYRRAAGGSPSRLDPRHPTQILGFDKALGWTCPESL